MAEGTADKEPPIRAKACPDGPTDFYLVIDGKRIAKRGKSGTLHAMTWISLEPGVVVRDVPMPESESGWGMVVEINSVRVH